jgi:hypothetical protein
MAASNNSCSNASLCLQAMLHCLRALALLGVPMPWDPQYRKRRRWWHCSFDACFVAGLCCCSVSASFLSSQGQAAGQGDATTGSRRVGDEMGMGEQHNSRAKLKGLSIALAARMPLQLV